MQASMEQAEAPARAIEGYVDAVEGGRVFGWAWDRDHPRDRIMITVRIDGAEVAVAVADRQRIDLISNGIGDGRHAFEILLEGEAAAASLVVEAQSPTTGGRVVLAGKPVDAAPEDDNRRLVRMVEALAVSQRQIGNALHGVLREIRAAQRTTVGVGDDAVEKAMAQMVATQQDLQRQIAGVEVFLLRFEAMMRAVEEQAAAFRVGAADRFARWAVVGVAAVAGVALAAALIL